MSFFSWSKLSLRKVSYASIVMNFVTDLTAFLVGGILGESQVPISNVSSCDGLSWKCSTA